MRRALAPTGSAAAGDPKLAAERAEAGRLRALVAHERAKVAALKSKLAARDQHDQALQHRFVVLERELEGRGRKVETLRRKLAARDERIRALQEELASLEAKLAFAEKEARVYRKNLRWIWARYPGTEQFWTKDPQDGDDPFSDRAQALKARLVDQLAAPEFAADDRRVTVVVTSCDRHDLLVRTLGSFFRTNTFPIEKVIVVEDGETVLAEDRKALFAAHPVEWISTGGRVGQIRAIDQAYARVSTPYIFHSEDDWDFLEPGYIERSMAILEAEPMCLQVWLRGAPGAPPRGHPFEDDICTTVGVAWRRVARGHKGVWHGFSFNPGLRRLRDYRVVGSSYASVAEAGLGGGPMAEAQLSGLYASVGYFAAAIWQNGEPIVHHTGRERHVA